MVPGSSLDQIASRSRTAGLLLASASRRTEKVDEQIDDSHRWSGIQKCGRLIFALERVVDDWLVCHGVHDIVSNELWHRWHQPYCQRWLLIFLKAVWILKGFLSTRASCSVCVSYLSRRGLVLPISLFCSPVLYFTPVSSCIALLVSEQAGMDKSDVNHCCSVIPLPLVNPPMVFILLMSTCSIIISGQSSPSSTTYSGDMETLSEITVHIWIVLFKLSIVCRYILADLA